MDEEAALIARAQAGDRDALRPLFVKYADPLYGAVLRRVGGAATAEDVVRDTFLVAVEKIGTFRWEGRGLFGWLRQIALNKVRDQGRRQQRTSRVLERLAAESPDATDEGADDALIAEEERRAARARVRAVLARVPERYATALRLRLLEDRPREECARLLGVTVGTFDVLLFRAVRSYRKLDGETP